MRCRISDKTNLAGRYDMQSFDEILESVEMEIQCLLRTHDVPDIFTAIQEELGLKLEPSKVPVACLSLITSRKSLWTTSNLSDGGQASTDNGMVHAARFCKD